MKRAVFLVFMSLVLAGTAFAQQAKQGKYTPAIEVTAVRAVAPTTTLKYAEGESLDNNSWSRAYLNDWGIKIRYLWTVDGSQWPQKVNLMMASGEFPDIFQATLPQFQQMYEAGLLQDLTSAYARGANDNARKVLTEGGTEAMNTAMRDGKLMAIPFTGMPKEGVYYLNVRQDWMSETKAAPPANWSAFVALLQKFKAAKHNGTDYAIGTDNALTVLYSLFQSFHSYPTLWVDDGKGNLVYGALTAETRKALVAMQDLYKKGLLDPEFGTKDISKVYEDVIAGKVGVLSHPFWVPVYPFQPAKNNDKNLELEFYPLPSADAQPVKYGIDVGTFGYWVVNKSFKYPEAAFLMLNTWVDSFYFTTSDQIYNAMNNDTAGNAIWENAFVRAYRGWKNLDGYLNINAYINKTKALSNLTPEERGNVGRIEKYQAGDLSNWSWGRIYGKGGGFKVINDLKEKNAYLTNGFIGVPTATMLDKQSVLDKLQLETFTKIIQGGNISAFDGFVTQWKSLGGDQITKEVNAWKKAQK